MFRAKNNTIPEAFWTKLQIAQHNYVTGHGENIFEEPKMIFGVRKFAIPPLRGPCLWNKHTYRLLKAKLQLCFLKQKLKNI